MVIRDGDWTLFDYNPVSGKIILVYSDGIQTVYRTEYPIDNILAYNQEMRKETSGRRTEEWEHVASIPINLAYASGFMQAHKEGDHRFTERWLNDSDNRLFRTTEKWV